LPGLALNCDPPNLSLPSSWDSRCESPVSSTFYSSIRDAHPVTYILNVTLKAKEEKIHKQDSTKMKTIGAPKDAIKKVKKKIHRKGENLCQSHIC
jgi:hypothetical protein